MILDANAVSTQTEQAADAVGYQLSQVDVQSILSLATSVEVTLLIIVVLLAVIAGLIFAQIATKGWTA
jgi:hypothetical protein